MTTTFKRASQEQLSNRQDVVVIADATLRSWQVAQEESRCGYFWSIRLIGESPRELLRDNGSGRLKARATDGYMGAEYPREALQGASGVARYELRSQQLDSLIFGCTLGVLAQRAERLLRGFVRDIGMAMMCPYLCGEVRKPALPLAWANRAGAGFAASIRFPRWRAPICRRFMQSGSLLASNPCVGDV